MRTQSSGRPTLRRVRKRARREPTPRPRLCGPGLLATTAPITGRAGSQGLPPARPASAIRGSVTTTPFRVGLRFVVALREQHVQVGIVMRQSNFIMEASIVEAGEPQQNSAIRAGLQQDPHEDPSDAARDDDAVAGDEHDAAALVRAAVGNLEVFASLASPAVAPMSWFGFSRRDVPRAGRKWRREPHRRLIYLVKPF